MIPPDFRDAALELAEERGGETLDLVILGGGVHGCGILLEAARRGLTALLVERQDIASGTSSRSSKLIHGGLRYLKELQPRVTRDSCRERDRMLAANPELVRPLPFLYPVRRGASPPGWLVEAGLWIYDRLTDGEPHRRLGAAEAELLAPQADFGDLDRALLYRDAVADDARLTLAVAATAHAFGGALLTWAEVEDGLFAGAEGLTGVVARDTLTGESHRFRARVVVNATGVWVDEVRQRLRLDGRRVRPSRGSHLVLRPKRVELQTALAFAAPDDRRPVFLIPHPEGILVGTTDLYHEGPLDDPRPSAEEIDYLLRAASAALPGADLGRDDVVGAFAGLRPILEDAAGKATTPSAASREEAVWTEGRLVSVAGGKLTTWRLTAHRAVEAALALLPEGRRRKAPRPFDPTGTPLAGVAAPDLPERLRPWARHAPAGVAPTLARRLRGWAAWAPRLTRDAADWRPLVDGGDLTPAEVRVHLAAGGVTRLQDLLLRRVRLGMWDPELARAHVAPLERLFRTERGWDAARWNRETADFARARNNWRPGP